MSAALSRWYHAELAAIGTSGTTRDRAGVVMGFPLWGEKFLDRYVKYFLRTVLEVENRKALRGSRVVIFTDERGRTLLVPHFLADHGIELEVRVMPPEVIATRDKYALLGACQSLCLVMAARSGMAHVTTHPDVLHCRGYFARLLELGRKHEAIFNSNFCAAESVASELARYKQADGAFSIGAVDLGELGFRHLHPRTKWRFVARGEPLPVSDFLMWQGREAVHFFTPHRNPSYLSARLCAEAKINWLRTLDAQPPLLVLPQTPVYAPTLADELTILEVSDAGLDAGAIQPPGTFAQFAKHFHYVVHAGGNPAEYLRFFNLTCQAPVMPQADYFTEAEVAAHQADIVKRLIAVRAIEELKQ